MKLSELLQRVQVLERRDDRDPEVSAVTRDSRSVGPDTLFVAVAGSTVDGHDYVSSLMHAAAVLVTRPVSTPLSWVVVPDTRVALARCAAALAGDPGRRLRVVGVTGTNGKTTVSTLVDEALRHCGRKSARIGTTGTVVDGEPVASELTTPGPVELQALLARILAAGVDSVAMEVSSIGLDQARVEGIAFHTAVFTNLSGDHLDYHGTMERYLDAKARLFRDHLRTAGGPPRALLCADDPAWSRMGAPSDRWTYGEGPGCDLRWSGLDLGTHGMRFVVDTPLGQAEVTSPLIGRYNASNLVAALGVLLTLDVELEVAARALSSVRGVPGRLESIDNERGLLVLVDYAHSDDSLVGALAAATEASAGKLWVVFGAGGNRDRAKRPRMGRAAERGADFVVVTSDNPRFEDPQQIVDEILSGMDSPPTATLVDRREAIRWALEHAAPGDTVLIAGKGHEDTQEIEGVKYPFDDRVVAREVLWS